jgi:hypothetical protein
MGKNELPRNKPQPAPRGSKKKYVVRAFDGQNEKTVYFGARGYEDYLTHGDEGRRANFKARHRCSEKTNKLTPGWWACNYNW